MGEFLVIDEVLWQPTPLLLASLKIQLKLTTSLKFQKESTLSNKYAVNLNRQLLINHLFTNTQKAS